MLTLSDAQTIVAAALAQARDSGLKPMVVVVMDDRGAVKAAAAEDGASLKRFELAQAKAFGALSLGMGSRSLAKRAKAEPHFIAAASHVIGGSLVPVAGGVLILDYDRTLLGAVGASGDTSDNDEKILMAALEKAGLVGDPGAD